MKLIIVGLNNYDTGKKIKFKKTKEDIIEYIGNNSKDTTISTNDLDIICKEIFDLGFDIILVDKVSDYMKNVSNRYVKLYHNENNNFMIEWVIRNKNVLLEYIGNINIRKVMLDMLNFKR